MLCLSAWRGVCMCGSFVFVTHTHTQKSCKQSCKQQSRFQNMTDSIIGRIDEMGSRIDELEKSVGELIQHAGVEAEQSVDDKLIAGNHGEVLKTSTS